MPSTRDALLQKAETLIRTRGYAAFSFSDLASHAAISKPSVHHHFPTKADLGVSVLADHRRRALDALERLDRSTSPRQRLNAFGDVFVQSVSDGMLPLCAALAAERDALPQPLQDGVRDFIQAQRRWVADVVAEGVASGELNATGTPDDMALQLISLLQGASLVAWAMRDSQMVARGFATQMSLITRAPGDQA